MGKKYSSSWVDWALFSIALVPPTNGTSYPCFFFLLISSYSSPFQFHFSPSHWVVAFEIFHFFFIFHDTGCSPLFLRLMEHFTGSNCIFWFGSFVSFDTLSLFSSGGYCFVNAVLAHGYRVQGGHDETAVMVIGTKRGKQKELPSRFLLCV